MFSLFNRHLKLGLADWTDTNLVNWVLKHPGQVVLTVVSYFSTSVYLLQNQISGHQPLVTSPRICVYMYIYALCVFSCAHVCLCTTAKMLERLQKTQIFLLFLHLSTESSIFVRIHCPNNQKCTGKLLNAWMTVVICFYSRYFLESMTLWLKGFQILYICVQTQIHFNKDVQAALDQTSTLIATRDNMVSQLNELAGLVLSPLIAFQRQSIEALLTITVHNRDIMNTLIKQRVSKPSDFEWKKHVYFRAHYDKQFSVFIKGRVQRKKKGCMLQGSLNYLPRQLTN